MKFRETLITIFLTLLVCGLFALNYLANRFILDAESIYKVYLNGQIMGFITNDDELYGIINERQKEIKEKFEVDKVYPPSGFEIVKTNSYNVTISSAEEVYEKMAELESFTIEGFIITIKRPDDTKITINVLDYEMFDESVYNFVMAFLEDDEYSNYINNSQAAIETTGKIIEKMYFDETITVKQGYVDVDSDIYTNEPELTQYLLFGKDAKINHYTVKAGDTIVSVSQDNKLNPQEFLIANPQYTSKDSLLKIGDKVNITLINPVLTFIYEVNEVSDAEQAYSQKIEYDSKQPAGYSEVTTQGVTGITRITQNYTVKNGEMQAGVEILSSEVITEKVDEVITKGGSKIISGPGSYVDTGDLWGWPTNYPYVITSYFEWRWGVMHEGIDISGTGANSPIYAVLDGIVAYAGWEGKCGYGAGVCVLLQHYNGYYTIYAHMTSGSIQVKEGDTVSRGQILGGMGATGYATGIHLHFGVWYGIPYASGSHLVDPMRLW